MNVVKILGVESDDYKLLLRNLQEAVQNCEGNFKTIEVNKVTEILKFDLRSTPALSIDNQIITQGQVISSKEISQILKKFED